MTTYDKEQTIWQAAREAMAQLGPFLSPTIQHYKTETGLDGWTWFLLVRVLTIAPDAATAALFAEHSPYSNPSRHLSHLQTAAAKGYVTETDGSYRLSERGQKEAREFVADLRAVMAASDPLPAKKSERLGALLDRLVQASLVAPLPADPWRLQRSRTLTPAPVPPFPFAEQAVSCLAAYRDDCHMAAWQPSGLSGPALESLTYLWRADNHSLTSLHKQLVRRAQPRQVYRDALDDLCARGYIEGDDDELRVTEQGRAFRQQVEADTDRAFFTPWSCLDSAELDELRELLRALGDGLRQSDGAAI